MVEDALKSYLYDHVIFIVVVAAIGGAALMEIINLLIITYVWIEGFSKGEQRGYDRAIAQKDKTA